MLNLLKCRKADTKYYESPMYLLSFTERLLFWSPGENVAMVWWVI